MKAIYAVAGLCLMLCLGVSVRPAAAQDAPKDTTRALRVFLDCGYCDLDFVRTEMPWVDYMQDRADAQVHILVTQEGTGGGGTQFTINFIGLKQFAARNDTLHYSASSNDSQDEIRHGLTRTLEIGILPFIAESPVSQRLHITMGPPGGGPGAGGHPNGPRHDPWNSWSFRVGFNADGNGQSQNKSASYNGNMSASRITEMWKITVSGSKSEDDQTYEIPDTDSTTVESRFITKSTSLSELIVRSLGANFSAGLQSSISTSTYGNTSRSLSVKPAIEYDFFPYKQSNRRMLTMKYAIGMQSAVYRDTTIFGKLRETHPQHSIDLSYNTQERWGSVSMSADYSQYLHDRSFYNAGVFGSADVRLFKGFSFNVFGDYSRVHDQLSLPKAGATLEEILLRQRELKTDYSYYVSVGLSYRFGSIFNNVVNPRFGGGGGGTIMIMN